MSRSLAAWTASGLAACTLAGCNLVLGIDDVSSADGPDSGQQVSAVSGSPETPAPEGADEDSGRPSASAE